MGRKKQGEKSRVIVIQKWRRSLASGLSSFWITMTLFSHLPFCNPYFGPFFTGSQTDPYFQNKSGCRLTERICFAPVETIWARPIIELNWVPLQKVFCWQKNWIYYMKILFWFGPAQNFLGSIKGQGISILHIQWKRQKICYLKPL